MSVSRQPVVNIPRTEYTRFEMMSINASQDNYDTHSGLLEPSTGDGLSQ